MKKLFQNEYPLQFFKWALLHTNQYMFINNTFKHSSTQRKFSVVLSFSNFYKNIHLAHRILMELDLSIFILNTLYTEKLRWRKTNM